MCALGLVLVFEGVHGARVLGPAARERLRFTPRETALALLVLVLLLYFVLMLASLFTGAWGDEAGGAAGWLGMCQAVWKSTADVEETPSKQTILAREEAALKRRFHTGARRPSC